MRLLIILLLPCFVWAQKETSFNIVWNGEPVLISNPNSEEGEHCIDKIFLGDSLLNHLSKLSIVQIEPEKLNYQKFDSIAIRVTHCEEQNIAIAAPNFMRERCLAVDSSSWAKETKTISWSSSEQLFNDFFAIEVFDTKTKKWIELATVSGFQEVYTYSLSKHTLTGYSKVRVSSRKRLINHNCTTEEYDL